MALTQGIFLVQEHSHWLDSQQIFSGRVTIEVNTALGSVRKEFDITASDIVGFLSAILNLLTSLAVTYQVNVQPISSTSWESLSGASTLAQAKWEPS